MIVTQGGTRLKPGEKILVTSQSQLHAEVISELPFNSASDELILTCAIWFTAERNYEDKGIWVLELGYGTVAEGLMQLEARHELNDPRESWFLPKSWDVNDIY